jgi:gamma-carbonic anhydrase
LVAISPRRKKMPIIPFAGKTPRLAEGVFVAEGAWVIGDVTIGEGSSVWFNTVVRGDTNSITIGRNTNVQDLCTIHVDPGSPCQIGDGVTIGHGAIVHGAIVEDDVLIGINAVVLNQARIGAGSTVGANALVPQGKEVQPRSLAVGTPVRVIREVDEEGLDSIRSHAEAYLELSDRHRRESIRDKD